MNDEQLIAEDTTVAAEAPGIPQPKARKPKEKFIPSVVLSGIKSRLLYKRDKASNFGKACDFALQLVQVVRVPRRTAVLSVKQQFGLTTRQARLAVWDARKRKHRKH
jgi:hypothetical protein